jgi:hypothetical protein
VSGSWPLIGRGAEYSEVRTLLGGGRGVVVAGPPGVGKTRLLDEVIGALNSDDWHVERVVGTPAISKLPLAAFAFIEEPVSMDLDRFPMAFGSAHRSLVERANGRRLLLVIDDAHCLDDVSAALAY